MEICDIHTHILPGVDDGASTLLQSLAMLRNAAASDVTTVVLTPHCAIPGFCDNFYTQELQNRFFELQQEAKQIPVQLLLGSEVRVTDRLLPLLESGMLPTINGSRYLLTEFPSDFPAALFPRVLSQLLSRNVIPLVAHPERYAAVCQDPLIVEQWVDMGCHIQITGGSIVGRFGKASQKASKLLLLEGLVCCVASDAHDTFQRSNFLTDVYDHLSIHYSRQCADILMSRNPKAICNDQLL